MTERSPVPLILFSGPRSLSTAALASRYYLGTGIAATVVRPRGCASYDVAFASGTRFIDDEALPGVEEIGFWLEEQRATLAQFNRTPGWFLQQFIKLVAVTQAAVEFVFVADGDTVFSRALLGKVLHDPIVLTTGEEFASYDRLLPALGLTPPRSSCVANGNIFTTAPIVRTLATANGFKALLRDHVLPSRGTLDFSEYQITGSLLEPRLGSRRIRMFRRFDLLVDDIAAVSPALVERALQRYDAVAIEVNHHRSVAKRLAARAFYGMGLSW